MSRSLLLFLGVVALGGGAFYLYKSGKLVGTPGEMAYGTPKQMFLVRQPIDLHLSGYSW